MDFGDLKRRKLKDTQMSFDLDDNMDSILNLEEQYYREGYLEGQEESTRLQYIEGKEYGYQTGFQRFLILGYIKGLLDFWEQNLNKYEAKRAISGHIAQSRAMIEEIPISNEEEAVKQYEKNVNKIRNKARIIAALCKEQDKINKVDDLIREIGGQMQVSENVDEMW